MPAAATILPWNSHWGGGPVSPLILRHAGVRAPVPRLVESLLQPDDPQWTVLAGPRQIGKTTTLGHVARSLLGTPDVPPRSIAVVPFDQPAVLRAFGNDFDALMGALGTLHVATPEQPLFLLMDEVQEVDDWARRLKAAWDRHHREVRVLATGSSAMRIVRPANADFPGRVRTRTMHPMKFREVLLGHPERARYAPEPFWQGLEALAKEARGAMTAADHDFRAALQEFHVGLEAVPQARAFAASVFQEYCLWGGYPSARPGSDLTIAARRETFEQAWNAVLARDAPAVGIIKTREFSRLFEGIAARPGSKFVPHSAAKAIGAKSDTVSQWKRVLEDALLVQQLPALKDNLRPTKGKDKVYTTDPGWFGHVTGRLDAALLAGEPEYGLLVETVLVDHARRLQFNLAGTSSLPFGYVGEPEVDVAASLGRRWLLLEAKLGGGRSHLTAVGGVDALRVVATRDHFELPRQPGEAFHIPAHEWALLC